MNTVRKIAVLLLAAGLAMAFVGCPTDGGDDSSNNGDGGGGTVSFNSFSPPSIYVDNKSGERLVAFKGSLNPNYLIGGIPAYASNHGLEKRQSLFSQTSDFALILVKESDYNTYKNNISAAPVFAEIYAFYNNEATNNNRFAISSKSGGTGRITLNNPTNWSIEIRRDGPTGEIMGYVAAQMTNTVLRVNAPDDYSLYPVLKRYNPIEKEIYEAVPKYIGGAIPGLPYAKDFALGSADATASWNLNEVTNQLSSFSLTSGSFYLRIQNNSNTAVRFTRGDNELVTSIGILGIRPSTSNTYAIKVGRNPDRTYPPTETVAGLKIGTMQNAITLPSQTFKVDYIYTITVTGSDASNLALSSITESENPLNVEEIFAFR